MNFKECYSKKIKFIDDYIVQYFKNYNQSDEKLRDAMSYSVLNGGKRLRSILCLEICRMFGGSESDAIPFATAIELIHAYSLVHDDLPAMDNADYRRGQLSCHKKYGEAMGILCGDALLNSAYELMISHCDSLPKVKAMREIAYAAGACGMINGQVLDLNMGSKFNGNEQMLIELVEQKTMALIRAAVLSGTHIAQCDESKIKTMNEFSYHLGMAFQIRDDFEDEIEDMSQEADCPNFINALGREKALEKLDYHCSKSHQILSEYDTNGFLVNLHNYLFT